MQIAIAQVNAFTANSKGGNPAGVVLKAEGLSDVQMLSIAKQAAYSETAFITNSPVATRRVRFFTPTEEVDLCGHATIASWSYMFRQGLVTSGDYTQDTKAGLLKVTVSGDGLVYMQQTKADFFEEVDAAEIAPILKISTSDFNPYLKPQIVSTGLRDLFVPVASEAVLNSIKPDLETMTEISRKYAVTGLHVFALTLDQESVVAARNFAPLYGIDEESATGTSNGAMLCYLKSYKALPDQAEYRIEQGKTMHQLSHIYGTFKDDIVWVGGRASMIKESQILV